MKTNLQMYKEVYNYFFDTERAEKLKAENIREDAELRQTIIDVFELEKRSELDLANLTELLVSHTLHCGTDVLKAKHVKGFEVSEAIAHKTNEIGGQLLLAINNAISDVKRRKLWESK